jgi:acyl dehydratase
LTSGRPGGSAPTITETDLVNFAMLSGDWNPIHTDDTFAPETRFGRRVVYRIPGLVIATGLLDRSGLFTGSTAAAPGIDEGSARRPSSSATPSARK